jgi:hypothetical protein
VIAMRHFSALERYRRPDLAREIWQGFPGDDETGLFIVQSPIDRANMAVIASNNDGWDHVSVSRKSRCPNWPEMTFVKQLFYYDHETVVEYHVPPTDHVNMARYALHLWRCQGQDFPRPPSILVGIGGTPVRDMADATARMKSAGLI